MTPETFDKLESVLKDARTGLEQKSREIESLRAENAELKRQLGQARLLADIRADILEIQAGIFMPKPQAG
jgi:cell shape-determining protein MreC